VAAAFATRAALAFLAAAAARRTRRFDQEETLQKLKKSPRSEAGGMPDMNDLAAHFFGKMPSLEDLLLDLVSGQARVFVEKLELEMLLSHFVLFTTFLFTEDDLKQRRYEPFIMNALREGVVL
jgi:hypothetical protein